MKGQFGTYAYSPFLSPQSAHFGQHYLVTCRHIAEFVFVALQVRLSAVIVLRQAVIARRQKGGWNTSDPEALREPDPWRTCASLTSWTYLASSAFQKSHLAPTNFYTGMWSLLDLKLSIGNFLLGFGACLALNLWLMGCLLFVCVSCWCLNQAD